MLAVHLFFLLNRFKHEGSGGRFRSRRQTAVFVFICATSGAEQRVASSALVPILRACTQTLQRSVRHQYIRLNVTNPRWTTLSHLLHHSGCSSWFPVRCLRCPDHPHWQNSHPLQRKRSVSADASAHDGTAAIKIQRQHEEQPIPQGHHLNNSATGCWREPPQSGSSLCEKKAVGVAGDKLSFLQPREFSSSGNRTWSAPPIDKNNACYVSNQNWSDNKSVHVLPIVLCTKLWCVITVFLVGRKSFLMRKKFFPYCLRPLMKRFCRKTRKDRKV